MKTFKGCGVAFGVVLAVFALVFVWLWYQYGGPGRDKELDKQSEISFKYSEKGMQVGTHEPSSLYSGKIDEMAESLKTYNFLTDSASANSLFTIDDLCYRFWPWLIDRIETGEVPFQTLVAFDDMKNYIDSLRANTQYNFDWNRFWYRIGIPVLQRENIWIVLPEHSYNEIQPLYLQYVAFNAEYVSDVPKITYVMCIRDLEHKETYIGEYRKDGKNKNLLHVKEELNFKDFRKFLRKSQPFGRSFFENINHHLIDANDLE